MAPAVAPSPEISEDPTKLLAFKLPSLHAYGLEYHADTGVARNALAGIFSRDATYVFMRTAPNPHAVKVLPNYIGTRRNMASPWHVRLKQAGEQADCYEGSRDGEPNGLWFSRGLLTTALEAVRRLADTHIGPKSHVSYPLVSGHPEGFLSPTIHLVKGRERAETLRGLVRTLLDEEGFDVISRIQAPQNYQMAAFQWLRNEHIAPLVLHKREWEVPGRQLRDAIDFLVPLKITSESRSLREDD